MSGVEKNDAQSGTQSYQTISTSSTSLAVLSMALTVAINLVEQEFSSSMSGSTNLAQTVQPKKLSATFMFYVLSYDIHISVLQIEILMTHSYLLFGTPCSDHRAARTKQNNYNYTILYHNVIDLLKVPDMKILKN